MTTRDPALLAGEDKTCEEKTHASVVPILVHGICLDGGSRSLKTTRGTVHRVQTGSAVRVGVSAEQP